MEGDRVGILRWADGPHAGRSHGANAINWAGPSSPGFDWRYGRPPIGVGDDDGRVGMTGRGYHGPWAWQVLGMASHALGRDGTLVRTCQSLIDISLVARENETAGPNPSLAADVGPAFCLEGV